MSAVEQLPDYGRQVLIGVNPRAGAGNRLATVEELCRQLVALDVQAEMVTDIDRLVEKAAALKATGQLRAVVAAGGDGTLRLYAHRTAPGTPLLVFPLGTENLLAKYLELTADPLQAARLIAEGLVVRFDAGEANGQIFTLMAGCGFDAEVVRRLHEERTGNIHHLSYARPILDAIRQYGYPELRVYCAAADDDREEASEPITARWAFVVNLPRYAGGLRFAPDASGSDGLLDVCTFKEGSLWHGMVYLGGVMLGQHESMQDFVRVRAQRVRIEADGPVPYQLDGDPGGELPVEIRVLPSRLSLVVSRPWAIRKGLLAQADRKESAL